MSIFFLQLQPQYGYVLIITSLNAFLLMLIGFIFPGISRSKHFNLQFMKQHFGKIHQQTFGQQIQKGGLPDMGSGKYAQKLGYKQWLFLLSSAHYNFVQGAPSFFIFTCIGGIKFPIPAASIGLAYFLGRIFYSIGYHLKGPKGRMVGALILDLAILGNFGLSIASGVLIL